MNNGPSPTSGERVPARNTAGLAAWRGAAPPMTTSENAAGTARRLARRLRQQRRLVAVALICTLISGVLMVLGPRLLGRGTDVIVRGLIRGHGINFAALRNAMVIALFVYLASGVVQWANGRMMARIVHGTMGRLREEVEDKIHRLPLSYVDQTSRGDLLSRVTNDVDNLAQSLQMVASQGLGQIVLLVGTVVMMMTISPLLAVVSIVLIPTSLALVRFIGRISRRAFGDQWRHTGELNGMVEETFSGHALVKVFGQQRAVEDDFERTNDELFRSATKAQFVVGVMQPIMMLLGNLNYVAIAVIGGLRITSGAMTVGEIQAYIQYSRMFTQPLTMLASLMNMVQSGLASAERVFELLDAPEQSTDTATTKLPANTRGRVEFSHVSFRYLPDRPLIEDLSFVAEPGETVAIVGPTGAGKTTLVNLIMRFYEVDAGTITLDGLDIAALSRHDVRSRIGMVLQDTWLFGGSIWDNLRYGRLDASESEILEAAKTAYVDRFVHALPDGYETMLDEDGGNLSAGEKQLLTIARAFLRNPAILVLDEATSSVDTRTEVLVQRAMGALRSGRTSFVIAHRLSTIRDANHILMMENGRIVEQGSHDQLLARKGAYFRLYQAQFRAPAVDIDPVPTS